MEYKILATEKFTDLESLVNKYLNDGWEIQGGISSISFQERVGGSDTSLGTDVWTFRHFQAMAKKTAQ